jgi:hypothetical protein
MEWVDAAWRIIITLAVLALLYEVFLAVPPPR